MPIVVGGALTMESIACFVAGSRSLVSKSDTLEHLCTNMREYQHDNTRLYFLVTPSFNFQGPWEQNDIEMIQRDYTKKLLRDGNGILQWFISAVTMVR